MGCYVYSRTTTSTSRVACASYGRIDEASRKNALMRAARLDLDVFAAKLAQARGAAWPSVTLSGQSSVIPALSANNGQDTIINWTRPGLAGRIEASAVLPIYTFGKLDALRRLAERGVDISRAQESVARGELEFQATRAYWGWVLADEFQAMADSGVKHFVDLRKRLEKQRDEGAVDFDPTDLLKVKVYEADLTVKIREIARLAALSRLGLATVMGAPKRQDFRPRDTEMIPVAFKPLPVEEYQRLARLNRPQLVALRGGVLARRAERDLYRANRLPDLFVAGGWTYANATNVDAPSGPLTTNGFQYNYGGAFLGLRWSLDLGRFHRATEAEAELAKLEAQETAALEGVDLEIDQLYREATDNLALLDVFESSMKAARGWLNAENDLYQSNLQDLKDVLIPIEQYYRRRLAYLEAIYNFNVSVAKLSRAVGVDVGGGLAKPSR